MKFIEATCEECDLDLRDTAPVRVIRKMAADSEDSVPYGDCPRCGHTCQLEEEAPAPAEPEETAETPSEKPRLDAADADKTE